MKFETYIPTHKISATNLISLESIPQDDVFELIANAYRMKNANKVGERFDTLKGKNITLITNYRMGLSRLSFSLATTMLSASHQTLPLGGSNIEAFINTPEMIGILEKMNISAFVVDTLVETDAKLLHDNIKTPVINAFGENSPCGAIAALLAVFERRGTLSGLNAVFVTKNTNKVSSMLAGAVKCGMDVTFVAPEEKEPTTEITDYCRQFGDVNFNSDMISAIKTADVIVVNNDFGDEYKLDEEKLSYLKQDACIIHALPFTGADDVGNILGDSRMLVVDTGANLAFAEASAIELLIVK